MFSIHDREAVDRFRRDQRFDPGHIRTLRNSFCKHRHGQKQAVEALPMEVRNEFSWACRFHALERVARFDSQLDGASKLLFRTDNGDSIETVILRIASGRTSVCVSSQAGCAAHCSFCATGKMGIARSLSAAEILDQVVQANQELRNETRRIRNVVFMGMGEPFHNTDNVFAAVEALRAPDCFEFSGKHILVSTVGIPDELTRCARRFPDVRLAVSLHSALPEVREQLIPLARRYGLAELREAIVEATVIQRQPMLIEYLLLSNVNDTQANFDALVEYLRGLDVFVNLIPYNPIDDAPELVGTAAPERRAFAQALKQAGFRVTLRHSLGGDIAAACGQLVRRESRTSKPIALG